MRILVTGGGGFLGHSIIKELLKNPTSIVTNFSRHSYSFLEDLGVPTIKGDLRKKEDISRALSYGFDAIIHSAAYADVWGKYEEFYETNFVGTKNLVELGKSLGVKKFLYTSTPSVVFEGKDLLGVGEETPYAKKFLTAYAETKAMAEALVLKANESESFLTCALRPHLIWGPGDPHIIPRLLQRARLGKLRKVGEGENLVDVIYVENAARAHVQALKHLSSNSPLGGEAYFLGQERPVRLWDFIGEILRRGKAPAVSKSISLSFAYQTGKIFEKTYKLLGIYKPVPPMTRFVALNLAKSHYFSHEKARKHFGYVPMVSIEEGLKRTFSEVNN